MGEAKAVHGTLLGLSFDDFDTVVNCVNGDRLVRECAVDVDEHFTVRNVLLRPDCSWMVELPVEIVSQIAQDTRRNKDGG